MTPSYCKINTLLISPYSSKTWLEFTAKSLSLKDRVQGGGEPAASPKRSERDVPKLLKSKYITNKSLFLKDLARGFRKVLI